MAEGQTDAHVASRLSVSKSAVQRHRSHPRLPVDKKSTKALASERLQVASTLLQPTASAAPVLKLPADASETERAKVQIKWIEDRINWGQSNGEGVKELQAWTGQLTNASRHLAKLSGAYEVTEAQIVKSPKFVQAIRIIIDAVGENEEILRRIRRALEIYEKGESDV